MKNRRTKLRLVGHSTTTELKNEIQALLRKLGLLRDGGCVLRNYDEAGQCGGRNKNDELILQAEHLVTRSNTASFGDLRNIVILCRNHHIFWKPQHSSLYWELIQKHLGKEKWDWVVRMRDDRTPHKVDLKLVKIALEQDLEKAIIKSQDIL